MKSFRSGGLFGRLVHGLQTPALKVLAVILFQKIDAVRGDHQLGAIVALDEFLLREIPDRKLEMLPRAANKLLELGGRDPRTSRFLSPLGMKRLQDGEPRDLFELEVVFCPLAR